MLKSAANENGILTLTAYYNNDIAVLSGKDKFAVNNL